MGPRNSEERKARAKLESALIESRYLAAIGWAVSLGRHLKGHVEDVYKLEADLQLMPAKDSRECSGWALLLHFTLQVMISID